MQVLCDKELNEMLVKGCFEEFKDARTEIDAYNLKFTVLERDFILWQIACREMRGVDYIPDIYKSNGEYA